MKQVAPGVWEIGYLRYFDYDAHQEFMPFRLMVEKALRQLGHRKMKLRDGGWENVNQSEGDRGVFDVSGWHPSPSEYEAICVDGEGGTWIEYRVGLKFIVKQLKIRHVYLLERGAVHRAPLNTKPRRLLRYWIGL